MKHKFSRYWCQMVSQAWEESTHYSGLPARLIVSTFAFGLATAMVHWFRAGEVAGEEEVSVWWSGVVGLSLAICTICIVCLLRAPWKHSQARESHIAALEEIKRKHKQGIDNIQSLEASLTEKEKLILDRDSEITKLGEQVSGLELRLDDETKPKLALKAQPGEYEVGQSSFFVIEADALTSKTCVNVSLKLMRVLPEDDVSYTQLPLRIRFAEDIGDTSQTSINPGHSVEFNAVHFCHTSAMLPGTVNHKGQTKQIPIPFSRHELEFVASGENCRSDTLRVSLEPVKQSGKDFVKVTIQD